MLEATTKGGAHYIKNKEGNEGFYGFFKTIPNISFTAKQAVLPGMRNWMCPETAFSDTPDSNQIWLTSLQAVFMAIRASKLSTQLSTKSTGPPVKLPAL